MTTRLAPAADMVLSLAVDRALTFVRRGDLEDAVRALIVGADTANLIDVAERAAIVRAP